MAGMKVAISLPDSEYGKESAALDPALKYAQLERLSREAWFGVR